MERGTVLGDDPMVQEVAAERSAGAAGRRILRRYRIPGPASGCRPFHRRSHHLVRREQERPQLVETRVSTAARERLPIDGHRVHGGARSQAGRTGTARRRTPPGRADSATRSPGSRPTAAAEGGAILNRCCRTPAAAGSSTRTGDHPSPTRATPGWGQPPARRRSPPGRAR